MPRSSSVSVNPEAAKAAVFEYCRRKGALAVGVADLAALDRIAPPGHRPRDIMPRVRSVISFGVGGQTQGTWTVPAKAMGYFGSTEGRAYTIAYGLNVPAGVGQFRVLLGPGQQSKGERQPKHTCTQQRPPDATARQALARRLHDRV